MKRLWMGNFIINTNIRGVCYVLCYISFIVILIIILFTRGSLFSFSKVLVSLIFKASGFFNFLPFGKKLIAILLMFTVRYNALGLFPIMQKVTIRPLMMCLVLCLYRSIFLYMLETPRRGGARVVTHIVTPGGEWLIALPLLWVEVVRYVIRPIRLCLRIAANFIVGHVILVLIASVPTRILGLFIFIWLFEVFVAVLQTLIFVSLLYYYFSQQPGLVN